MNVLKSKGDCIFWIKQAFIKVEDNSFLVLFYRKIFGLNVMQKQQLKRILIFQLLIITGFSLFNACNMVAPPTPTISASPIATTMNNPVDHTAVPDLPAPTSQAVNATPLSTVVSEITNASLLPGWAWYESPNGVYATAYPQQWQTGTVVGAGVFTFSSPETNSQIRISSQSVSFESGSDDGAIQFPDAPTETATPAPPACYGSGGMDWLDTVRANRSSMPGLPYETDIAFNATYGGQPAYFYFTPSPGAAGGNSALLLFCNSGTIVSLYYQSSMTEPLPAEAAIYQQMLASLVWHGQTAEPLDIPFEQLSNTSSEMSEITAVVGGIFTDSGVIVLQEPVNGFVTITLGLDGRVQTENGESIDLDTIHPGQQIRAVGENGQAGTLLAQEIEILE